MSYNSVPAWNFSEFGESTFRKKRDNFGESNPSLNFHTDDEKELDAAGVSLMRKLLRSKLVESTHSVEIQHRDPSSPLYSVKSFEELNLRPELLKGVYSMGFNSPSKIQESALPILLADPPQNMIAQSQSGTGKTAAFILSSLSRINPHENHPQVLVLLPTFELAQQIESVAKKMAAFCPEITFRLVTKGEERSKGHMITEHVLIGTPGKVFDWALRFKYFVIAKIKVFILDEADIMISTQGHCDQSIRIHKKLSRNCQMILFSATYTQEVMEFAELIIPDPVIIRLKKEEESLDNIKQFYVECRNLNDKFNALSNIYGVLSIGQTIIFCGTRSTAAWLSRKMTLEGHAVGLLSAELTIPQRINVLNRFRAGREKVLITTNVCARGIDVEQVTFVVNFDLPVNINRKADNETYLHRIGRTGRFGKMGIAVNLVDGNKSLKVLKDIEMHFGKVISKLDTDNVDEIENIGK